MFIRYTVMASSSGEVLAAYGSCNQDETKRLCEQTTAKILKMVPNVEEKRKSYIVQGENNTASLPKRSPLKNTNDDGNIGVELNTIDGTMTAHFIADGPFVYFCIVEIPPDLPAGQSKSKEPFAFLEHISISGGSLRRPFSLAVAGASRPDVFAQTRDARGVPVSAFSPLSPSSSPSVNPPSSCASSQYPDAEVLAPSECSEFSRAIEVEMRTWGITKINNDLKDVREQMDDNIDRLLDRGAKIEDTKEKTERMENEAIRFRRQAHAVHVSSRWKNVKLNLAIGLVLL
eukprot:gene2775-3399_t